MGSLGTGFGYYLLMAAELIATIAMFNRKLSKRKHWLPLTVLSVAASVGVIWLVCWTKGAILKQLYANRLHNSMFLVASSTSLLTQIVILGLYVDILLCLFDTSPYNAVFIGCTAFAMQNIAQCLYMLCAYARGNVPLFTTSLILEPENLFLFLLFFIIVYVGCYFIFVRRSAIGENVLNRGITFVLDGMILINLFLGAAAEPKDSDHAMRLFLFMLVARILICVMVLIIQYNIMRWMQLQLHEERLNRILKQQRDQYEIAKENIDNVNINAHDLRHQINMIMEAVHRGERMESVENGLNDMARGIDLVDTAYHTGNDALDVTLTEKARACIAHNIQLSVIADGSAVRFMDDVDIYTMFGNALDNAIEAAAGIAQKEERIISLSVRRSREMVSIHMENTCVEKPEFRNGLPQTGKQNKRIHGYGVRSIRHVAEKYGGYVKFGKQNDLFFVDIYVPELPI